jgi:hypothetical protein
MASKFVLATLLAAMCLLAVSVSAKSAQEWKTRNIYQIITDRYIEFLTPLSLAATY